MRCAAIAHADTRAQPARGIGSRANTTAIRTIIASLGRLAASDRRRRDDAVGRRRRAIVTRAARRATTRRP
ncbi:hypothetical protein WJ12_27915 [Burkholderia seminalis]|nr:hypothetical protein WJ12_27915 [Burkholderia seminalis]KVF52709.1 hypothetical protein WJ13_06420 [Burkholderia seminalis]RQS86632.1 hypothetical protein DF048_30530 [Burkholderia seminalis]